MVSQLHRIVPLPADKLIGDLLPAFSGIKGEIHLGKPNEDCASCRKPFDVVRRPRRSIRLYNPDLAIPVVFSYRVCGACLALYQRGGESCDAFLVAVEAYHDGIDPKSPRHDPTFPKQVSLGGQRAVGFVRAEIEAWLTHCVESSRGGKQ